MAGYENQWNNGGLEDPTPPQRNRRERPHFSDITRAVDKSEETTNNAKLYAESKVDESENNCDKNTPALLRDLRWEIYELLDRFDGDINRTVRTTLKMEIEYFFKKYTNS